MHYVYVLQSESSKELYYGYATNLEQRLQDHNGRRRGFTTGRGPWVLVYYEAYRTESSARERERKLKH